MQSAFTRDTIDYLLIDKDVLTICKIRNTNLALRWIDYQKLYKFVLHSWIFKTVKLLGMANNAVRLNKKSMKTWNT